VAKVKILFFFGLVLPLISTRALEVPRSRILSPISPALAVFKSQCVQRTAAAPAPLPGYWIIIWAFPAIISP
jgi:hypothetical protein